MRKSSLAEQAVAYGIASEAELASIAQGWLDWAQQPDGVLVVLHGEIIAHV
jgi:hypothetical protein